MTLAETNQVAREIEPTFGRFHISSAGELFVIITARGFTESTSSNYIGRVRADKWSPTFERIELKHPFLNFFTNTPRGGSQPSDVIDLFGIADDHPNLRYARIRIEPYRD